MLAQLNALQFRLECFQKMNGAWDAPYSDGDLGDRYDVACVSVSVTHGF